ncbi:hypothetical protein ACS3SW_09375 [Roseobacteraceae bacterium S113]
MQRWVMALVGLGVLAGCEKPDDRFEAPIPITTQADMDTYIAGRALSANSGQVFVITSDGRIVGTWDGKSLLGRYHMKGGLYCREIYAGPHGPTGEDCQVLVLDNGTLVFTRERGTGASFSLAVNGMAEG